MLHAPFRLYDVHLTFLITLPDMTIVIRLPGYSDEPERDHECPDWYDGILLGEKPGSVLRNAFEASIPIKGEKRSSLSSTMKKQSAETGRILIRFGCKASGSP
jgi:hypothetical protein